MTSTKVKAAAQPEYVPEEATPAKKIKMLRNPLVQLIGAVIPNEYLSIQFVGKRILNDQIYIHLICK